MSPEKDRATATVDIYSNVRDVWTCGLEVRERTDRHTDTFVAILRITPGGEVIKSLANCVALLAVFLAYRIIIRCR